MADTPVNTPVVTIPAQEASSLRASDPCVFVILGASGDLTKRLLLPALYNLAQQKRLPENFAILGYALADYDEEGFRQNLAGALHEFSCDGGRPELVEWIRQRSYFINSDFENPEGLATLKSRLAEIDKKYGAGGNALFYLATIPRFFLELPQRLAALGLLRQDNGCWRRLIIEKPFGRDRATARELNLGLAKILGEDQIYRIDHYLGKETVQNILAFRFANGIFEPIWNRRYIDNVQITVAEAVGVELRAAYYERFGALRDMVPNHVFQLVELTAMEPPISFEANAVRNEQMKILEALQWIKPENISECIVRGQYTRANDGSAVGYREEPGVKPDSNTETYVALELHLDNWRWAGVPFYVRTGKRLTRRDTEITIRFRRAPMQLFRETDISRLSPNALTLQIQPAEGVQLTFDAKVPGPEMQLGHVAMHFAYADYFGDVCRTGYETLLYDCMLGDATLFRRADMVETAWNAVEPAVEYFDAHPGEGLVTYPAFSAGPKEADHMLNRAGRNWHTIG